MSTKRILGITIAGILLIITLVIVMLIPPYLGRTDEIITLPEPAHTPNEPNEQNGHVFNALDMVEITPETVQAVILYTLTRPEIYSRNVQIRTYWEDGDITYNIHTAVSGALTAIRSQPSVGNEKRIIITNEHIYIWYRGDTVPFISNVLTPDDWIRTADEWRMLITYEDVINLNPDDIIDAGHIVYGDEDCIYVIYLSPLFGYMRTYYVSIYSGLVIAAEERDSNGRLVYLMTARAADIGEVDIGMFTLPDSTVILS
jgi:hypothetical protein